MYESYEAWIERLKREYPSIDYDRMDEHAKQEMRDTFAECRLDEFFKESSLVEREVSSVQFVSKPGEGKRALKGATSKPEERNFDALRNENAQVVLIDEKIKSRQEKNINER
jgi:hypothetical protein